MCRRFLLCPRSWEVSDDIQGTIYQSVLFHNVNKYIWNVLDKNNVQTI